MMNVMELKKQLEAVNEEVSVDIKDYSSITMFKNKNEVEIKLNFDDEFANVIDFIKNNVQEEEVERFLMKLE